jgi:hypothetical protein
LLSGRLLLLLLNSSKYQRVAFVSQFDLDDNICIRFAYANALAQTAFEPVSALPPACRRMTDSRFSSLLTCYFHSLASRTAPLPPPSPFTIVRLCRWFVFSLSLSADAQLPTRHLNTHTATRVSSALAKAMGAAAYPALTFRLPKPNAFERLILTILHKSQLEQLRQLIRTFVRPLPSLLPLTLVHLLAPFSASKYDHKSIEY